MSKKIKALVEEVFLQDDYKVVFYGQIKVELLKKEDLERTREFENKNIAVKRLFLLFRKVNNQFTKINRKKGLEFSEKLEILVKRYNELTSENETEVENIRDELIDLGKDYIDENESYKKLGIDRYEKIFYDILMDVKDKFKFEYPEKTIIELSKEINKIMLSLCKYVDWYKKESTKQKIASNIIVLLDENNYPPEYHKEVYEEVIRSILHLKNVFGSEWN